MIFDYYNFNSPEKGNENIFAYGDEFESITSCGFIHADTKTQAQIVLKANNKVWKSDCKLKHFTTEECKKEIERRREEQNKKGRI